MQEMQGTQVWPLDQEGPLEKENPLPGKFHEQRGAWGAEVHGLAKSHR